MNDSFFDTPVFVKDGQFLVLEIGSIGDALDFLEEWPDHRRDKVYDTAKRACSTAWEGRVGADAARSAFITWARWAGITEEVSVVLPWMTTSQTSRGGVPA